MPNPSVANKKSFWLSVLLGYVVIIICTFLPLLIAFSAGALAESHGCTVNEAGSHPCVIGGIDYGEFIAVLFVFGWFFMLSFPLSFAGVIVWTKKARKAYRFITRGAKYLLADIENLTTHEFEKRVYLEGQIDHSGAKHSIRVIFMSVAEDKKFKQGRLTTVGGMLNQNYADGSLMLTDARML